jgi:HEAT repeat protein
VSEFHPNIWRLQAQADIRGLMEAIKHTNPDVRKRAAAALRALGASSAIPGLQAALVKEHEPAVRATMIAALDSLFQQEVEDDSDSPEDQYNQVVRLIAQLNSINPERVIRAAQQLGELKEKIAAEALIMVFHNQEFPARVRLAAAEALLVMESAPVEVALLGAVRNADWRVRRNAAAVLGQLNADWAVEPLAVILRDENELVRRTAQAALQRIGTQEALLALAVNAAKTNPEPEPPPVVPVVEVTPPSSSSDPTVPAAEAVIDPAILVSAKAETRPLSSTQTLSPDEEETQPISPVR